MNQQMQDQEMKNPWSDQGPIPKVVPRHILLAAIACFVCALSLPLCANEWVALGVLAFLFAYVAIAVRSPVAVTLVLVTAVVAVMVGGGSFTYGAIFLSLAVGIATCAYLITVVRFSYFVLLLPFAAGAVAFLLGADLLVCLLSLAFLPAAALLAVATVKGCDRTSAICYTIAGMLASVIVLLLILVYQEYGRVGRSAIVGYIDTLRNGTVQTLVLLRDELLATMSQAVQDAAAKEAYDNLAVMLSDETLSDLVSIVFNILPAMAVVFCSIVAYEAQGMLNAVYYNTGLRRVVTPASCFFTMSVTAAVIYLLTFILTLVIPSSSMVSAVVQNICLMLLPGFCVLGIQSAFVSLARAKGGMRVFLLIFFGSMLCCYTGGALYVVAMWGAYGRIMQGLRHKMLEKLNQNRDGGDGQ